MPKDPKESNEENSYGSEVSEEEMQRSSEDSESDEADIGESDGEGDVAAIFKGPGSDEDDGEESEDGSSVVDDKVEALKEDLAQSCTFDMRNLMAADSHQIPGSLLYKNAEQTSEESITITLDKSHGLVVDEEFLLAKASAACTELVDALWLLLDRFLGSVRPLLSAVNGLLLGGGPVPVHVATVHLRQLLVAAPVGQRTSGDSSGTSAGSNGSGAITTDIRRTGFPA